jgi:hypothetical protein
LDRAKGGRRCDPNTSIRTKLQIPKIEIAAPYSDPDLICRKS